MINARIIVIRDGLWRSIASDIVSGSVLFGAIMLNRAVGSGWVFETFLALSLLSFMYHRVKRRGDEYTTLKDAVVALSDELCSDPKKP